MEVNENIMQIIVRHLNGEASPAEEATLVSWLEESREHRDEMDAYVKLWNDGSDVAIKHQFNTSDAWKKVEQQLRTNADLHPEKKTVVFSLKRVAVAAAVVAFVTIAAVYLFRANDSWKTIAALEKNLQVSLPDGSQVTLRRGSTLRYTDNFNEKNRYTELKGEAYFDVQRNEEKPFRVTTAEAIIEVLGTTFLIRHTDSSDQVVVTSGKVLFAEREKESNKIILTKGQEATLVKGRLTQDSVTGNNFMSWQSDRLTFNQTPLKQVVKDICAYYQVEATFTPEVEKDASTIKVNAEFIKEPLEDVLQKLELMTGLKITNENGIIKIRK